MSTRFSLTNNPGTVALLVPITSGLAQNIPIEMFCLFRIDQLPEQIIGTRPRPETDGREGAFQILARKQATHAEMRDEQF